MTTESEPRTEPVERASLWRHGDFGKLWAGQSVSVFGSMLSRIALPLTALLALDSGPLEQGLLQAVEAIPVLVVGFFAGVWVDRMRRRPLMIAADAARAALLLTIPLAAAFGALTMLQLYAVAAAVAVFSTLFNAAYPAYVPTLVGRERLVEANGKMAASEAIAEMGGFGIAGALVQYLSGPMAVVIDAATFLVSALTLGLIRAPEPPPPPVVDRESAWREAREGFDVVWRDRTLRALVGCSTSIRLAGGVFGAMYMIFAVRDLGLSPTAAGLIAAVGGIGSLAGASAVRPMIERFGTKTVLVIGFALGGALQGFAPLAHGSALLAGSFLVASQLFGDGLMTMAYVSDVALRQALVSDRLLGRVSATANVLGVVATPIGALAGGVMGELWSPRLALGVAAVGFVLSALWIVASPIREAPADAAERLVD